MMDTSPDSGSVSGSGGGGEPRGEALLPTEWCGRFTQDYREDYSEGRKANRRMGIPVTRQQQLELPYQWLQKMDLTGKPVDLCHLHHRDIGVITKYVPVIDRENKTANGIITHRYYDNPAGRLCEQLSKMRVLAHYSLDSEEFYRSNTPDKVEHVEAYRVGVVWNPARDGSQFTELENIRSQFQKLRVSASSSLLKSMNTKACSSSSSPNDESSCSCEDFWKSLKSPSHISSSLVGYSSMSTQASANSGTDSKAPEMKSLKTQAGDVNPSPITSTPSAPAASPASSSSSSSSSIVGAPSSVQPVVPVPSSSPVLSGPMGTGISQPPAQTLNDMNIFKPPHLQNPGALGGATNAEIIRTLEGMANWNHGSPGQQQQQQQPTINFQSLMQQFMAPVMEAKEREMSQMRQQMNELAARMGPPPPPAQTQPRSNNNNNNDAARLMAEAVVSQLKEMGSAPKTVETDDMVQQFLQSAQNNPELAKLFSGGSHNNNNEESDDNDNDERTSSREVHFKARRGHKQPQPQSSNKKAAAARMDTRETDSSEGGGGGGMADFIKMLSDYQKKNQSSSSKKMESSATPASNYALDNAMSKKNHTNTKRSRDTSDALNKQKIAEQLRSLFADMSNHQKESEEDDGNEGGGRLTRQRTEAANAPSSSADAPRGWDQVDPKNMTFDVSAASMPWVRVPAVPMNPYAQRDIDPATGKPIHDSRYIDMPLPAYAFLNAAQHVTGDGRWMYYDNVTASPNAPSASSSSSSGGGGIGPLTMIRAH